MSAADGPIGDDEADALFADFAADPVLILAVSGGPDLTALMYLAARWRARLDRAPQLVAVTVDHGLRPQARREAADVKRLAKRLGVAHRTVRWIGAKPLTGLQQAARTARYRLLATAAMRFRARVVLTAHTLDDQAETVLLRMARGSGLSGLAGMARRVPLAALMEPDWRPGRPAGSGSSAIADPFGADTAANATATGEHPAVLARPLLDITKARLIATLNEAGIAFAVDPSNADPRFTRARLRKLLPVLAEEGLTARRLTELARRVQRSEAALEAMVNAAAKRLVVTGTGARIAMGRDIWQDLPDEIVLRLLGRAIGTVGDEGPVELGKLESLNDALMEMARSGVPRFRRTLAGAMVSVGDRGIVIERAPRRRGRRS